MSTSSNRTVRRIPAHTAIVLSELARRGRTLRRPRQRSADRARERADHFSARAFSISPVTFSDEGFTLGWKRAITSPFRLTRNLAKFQAILPANLGLVSSLVRNS